MRKCTIVRGILCVLFMFLGYTSYTQVTYPVSQYTQLLPPYNSNVVSYYSGSREKLKVTLINTDIQQPLLRVYLRMKISSSTFGMQTPQEVFTPYIDLQAGIPYMLSMNDLAVYFKRENVRISGNQSQFFRTNQLPDNFYRFNFEVYEAGTNRLLSNPKIGFAQAMIASGEPPLLNLPRKGEPIKESNLPNIFFSWTPRHMNSVASAYGTEYEISLVEIYDKQTSPENAFMYSRVIYTETSRSTSFIHTAAQPQLIPGMRYAWRVRAVAKDGIEDANVFKNNGYSEIYWFDYVRDCQAVQIFGAVYDGGKVNITWQDVQYATDYKAAYRIKGTQRWYNAATNTIGVVSLYNLRPGTEYEYRIASRCAVNDDYIYSSTKGILTPAYAEKGPNCGLMPDINLSNQTPTIELQSGMPVLVGDFPVFISEVSGSGRFSGKGYVGIPYLKGAQLAVKFDNIVVNTDNRLIAGYFETVYDTKTNSALVDIDELITGGAGVGDIRTNEDKAKYIVNYTINPNIKAKIIKGDTIDDDVKEGSDSQSEKGTNDKYTVILTDAQGKEHEIEIDEFPATIEDKDGNSYVVNENGDIKPVSKPTDIKLNPATKETPRTDIAVIEFESTANTKYAIDQYKKVYEKVTEFFLKYKPADDEMIASAKFMLPNSTDELFVSVKSFNEGLFDPAKLRFIASSGKEYDAVYNKDKKGWTINLLGSDDNDGYSLYVVHQTGGDYATLAKLSVYSYLPKTVKLKLVPVNGFSNGFTVQALNDELNKIYGKVGISCEVEITPPFAYEPLKGKALDVTGSGLLSAFTEDMKLLNKAYIAENPNETEAILFIVEKATGTEKGTVYGDMPRGKQFGYLFGGASAQTIAHEIGHGLFKLEHPFKRAATANDFAEGDLRDNLMEYYGGTELVKLQWDAIHHPGTVIGIFERDEDAMSVRNFQISNILQEIKNTYSSDSDFIDLSKIKRKRYASREFENDSISLDFIYIEINGEKLNSISPKYRQEKASSMLLHEEADHTILLSKEIKGIMFSIGNSKKGINIFVDTKDADSFRKYLFNGKLPLIAKIFDGENEIEVDIEYYAKITDKPKMPKIKIEAKSDGYPKEHDIEIQLNIGYGRDGATTGGATISNLRGDKDFYPISGWKKLSLGEEWTPDFDADIRGGITYLLCKHDNIIDTTVFFIRGTNPPINVVKDYINQKNYLSQYWFLIKMLKTESQEGSVLRQFATGSNYKATRRTKKENASGEPLYGPPKGFGIGQLDNWAVNGITKYASSQHLWNWKENIEGAIEVIKQKKADVNRRKTVHNNTINLWNDENQDNPVNDSLYIESQEAGMISITEGNEVFKVNPTGSQRDIYDAMWIRLYNGGYYYNVKEPNKGERPRRYIYRTNNASKNYVQSVCSKSD